MGSKSKKWREKDGVGANARYTSKKKKRTILGVFVQDEVVCKAGTFHDGDSQVYK